MWDLSATRGEGPGGKAGVWGGGEERVWREGEGREGEGQTQRSVV